MDIKVLLFMYLCCIFCQPKEIFIQYSPEADNIILWKYLHGISNQFFVDIGGYDPTYASNTLPFTDWYGLNVEASKERARNFHFSRPQYVNVNFAMHNVSSQIILLYELAEDSGSTVSKQAKQTFSYANSQPTIKEQPCISLNMRDLCHKYYLKKPKFMSLDIEGYGYAPLSSNDWDNDLCVPELIIAEDSAYNVASGLPPIAGFLQTKNYTKREMIGLNTIYIHNKYLDFYIKQLEEGTRQFDAKFTVASWWSVEPNLISTVAPGGGLNSKHINLVDTQAYVHYSREQIISIPDILDSSNFISLKKNRSVLVMHFDPSVQSIYLGTSNFTMNYHDKGNANSYMAINAQHEGWTHSVFVYDQKKGEGKQPLISILKNRKLNQPCQVYQVHELTIARERNVNNFVPSQTKEISIPSLSPIEPIQTPKQPIQIPKEPIQIPKEQAKQPQKMQKINQNQPKNVVRQKENIKGKASEETNKKPIENKTLPTNNSEQQSSNMFGLVVLLIFVILIMVAGLVMMFKKYLLLQKKLKNIKLGSIQTKVQDQVDEEEEEEEEQHSQNHGFTSEISQ